MKHDSTLNGGGGKWGWVLLTEGGGSNSLTAAVIGPHGNVWPVPEEWEGTVSQRRSVDIWVVEGTEVLMSLVTLFGKVSADKVIGSVFDNLGAILGEHFLINDQLLSLWEFLCSLWKAPLEEPLWPGPGREGSVLAPHQPWPYGPYLGPRSPLIGPLPQGGAGSLRSDGIIGLLDPGWPVWRESGHSFLSGSFCSPSCLWGSSRLPVTGVLHFHCCVISHCTCTQHLIHSAYWWRTCEWILFGDL